MKTKFVEVTIDECRKGAKSIIFKSIGVTNGATYEKNILYLQKIPDHEKEIIELLREAERELNPATLSGDGEKISEKINNFFKTSHL